MKISTTAALAISVLVLGACGDNVDQPAKDDAAEFAARINGSGNGTPQSAPTSPTIAPPLEGAVPGVFEPGTATDPDSSICDATKMGAFYGREADSAVRLEIMELATSAREVRFVVPGPVYVKPDPTSTRLNIMLDASNIIRDVRCG